MARVNVTREQDTESAWVFGVDVGNDQERSHYTVTLEKSHWKELTDQNIHPETLVHRSFDFLLEREPKEAILSEFNLRTINQYFPEYEETLKQTWNT